jgi:hypothetical protein
VNPNDAGWGRQRTDLAICDCGKEFLSKIHIVSFGTWLTDRPCPKCGSNERVHEVVWNAPIPRALHFFQKLFR